MESQNYENLSPERRQTLIEILFDAMVCADHKAPEDDEFEGIIRTWARILAPVPDTELERAYVAAERKRTSFGMIAPGAIVQAYEEQSAGGGMEPPSPSGGASLSEQQYLERIADVSRRAHNYQFSHPGYNYQPILTRSPAEWRGSYYVEPLHGGPLAGAERAAVIHAIKCGATGDDIRVGREGDFADKKPISGFHLKFDDLTPGGDE